VAWVAVCTAITRASVSVTSVLRVCTIGARVDFIVVVVEWGGDGDLLLNEIMCVGAGDISDDAELIDARLIVISPPVMPIVDVDTGVVLCVCVLEAAARTSVRRLICRFPKPVCTRGSHCSSEVLRSTCTGWAAVVFPPCHPVFAVAEAAVLCCRSSSAPVSVVVVVGVHPVCIPGFQRSGGDLRMSLASAVVCACGIRYALIRLSY